MDIEGIHKIVHGEFGSAVGPVEQGRLFAYFEVDPDRIDEAARLLKTHPQLAFDSLSNLSGTDYPEAGKIQVTYHLCSFTHPHELVVKVDAEREAPRVKTVEHVWRAANWLEREVYDLLGVEFTGHGDLRRILLPDDWVGHPLRKDYVEAPEYHGISTVRESVMHIPGRR